MNLPKNNFKAALAAGDRQIGLWSTLCSNIVAEIIGESGFDWVIDPIDGTTNFVNGIPAWTVVLAGVSEAQTETGVIHDPNASETFSARRGFGATLNGQKLRVASDVEMASGSVAVGYSNRV